MKAIKTILQVPSGKAISVAHIEAVTYSATHMVNVEYNHNGKTFRVVFNDLYTIPTEIKE